MKRNDKFIGKSCKRYIFADTIICARVRAGDVIGTVHFIVNMNNGIER